MNLSNNILDSIAIERQRRMIALLKPDPYALVLWDHAVASLKDDAERTRLTNAFAYAKTIKYRHVGLTSDIYFSHPLRVAALAVLISDSQAADVGILALLHNVLEVSDISSDALAEGFGSEIAAQVTALTVDRAVQWHQPYKIQYYRRLMEGPHSPRVVKILDKVDNLFLLALNPDEEIKEKYLAEIERFVLPMTRLAIPFLEPYLKELIVDCRKIGSIAHPTEKS